jgi:hypothetical protein
VPQGTPENTNQDFCILLKLVAKTMNLSMVRATSQPRFCHKFTTQVSQNSAEMFHAQMQVCSRKRGDCDTRLCNLVGYFETNTRCRHFVSKFGNPYFSRAIRWSKVGRIAKCCLKIPTTNHFSAPCHSTSVNCKSLRCQNLPPLQQTSPPLLSPRTAAYTNGSHFGEILPWTAIGAGQGGSGFCVVLGSLGPHN